MSQSDRLFLRTLFLHPPSYDGFDGGAGARYQARREVRSFWYPTWLAQPAALVPGSRLIDAPPQGLTVDQLRPLAGDYDLAVLHTSTPSFEQDVRVAEALKASNASLRIGFVGAHVAVDPERALARSNTIEFVARNEFDFTIREVAQDRPLDTIPGLSFRKNGGLRHTPERPILENMDELPFVVDVYKRDLVVEHYAIGYLLHPYLSLYTGRGCRSKCTFCLWPQTVGGHRYRTRSVEHVADEIALATRYFPQVREYFFDDDTLTDDLPRIEALARRLGKLGVTWSCNAKANVPYSTLRVLKDNGLRLLLVGYESGNQRVLNNVKKGIRLDNARRFTKSAKALGIKIHGTFILGLPGESRETIEETIRFAQEIDPDTVQVSIAAPYPGTELYRQAVANGWLEQSSLVDDRGAQVSALSYPHLLSSEISRGTQEFYRRFYFRPRKIFSIAREMATDTRVLRRRLREGREFLQFMRARGDTRDIGRTEPDAAPLVGAARVQVVLSLPPTALNIAARPASVRIARDVAGQPGVGRILLCAETPPGAGDWQRALAGVRWTGVTGAGGSPTLAEALDPSAPVLVLAPDALPDAAWLRDLLADTAARPVRTTWLCHGRPAATFYPDALSLLGVLPGGSRDFPHQALSDPDAARVEAPRDAWSDLKDPDVVRRIERGLFRSLRQPSDGYLARNDRALSIALSRVLIRTPMTPNGITALSLIVGLVGAVMLAQPTWGIAMGGALALWACCILDGCDGEVARIKLLASPSGTRFDTVADNIVHLATFVAVAQHVHGVRPDLGLAGPATLLLTGMLLSMASVWWLINRSPPEQRAGFPRVFERIASRDYIYLVVALTAVERLHWFVWAAALGANAFWLSLWWWTLGRRRR